MKNLSDKLLVFIVGPTAVGKTAVSIEIAKHFGTVIISADSRQIFREMTIGTAKPGPEVMCGITHHLIDARSVNDDINAYDFGKWVTEIAENAFEKNDLVVVTGGSGLYLHAIWHGLDNELPGRDKKIRSELEKLQKDKGLKGLQEKLKALDPEMFEHIDRNNAVRLVRAIELCLLTKKPLSGMRTGRRQPRSFTMLKIGLELPRKDLHGRINSRVDDMMTGGLLKEARALLPWRDKNALQTVGYRELFRYFDGVYPLDEAIEKIKVNTRRYAKRQISWFGRYNDIHWFNPNDPHAIVKFIQDRKKAMK